MGDILLTEEILDPSIDELARRFSLQRKPDLWRDPALLREQLRDARAVIVRNMTTVDRAFMDAAPRLRVIGRIGVGLDNLDLAAISEKGVVVCYPPEENAVSVAEHVFALLLGFSRRLTQADRMVREGGWDRYSCVGFELAGKTLGLLGLGRIGFRVAVRARAFGMRVLAYDPYVTHQHPYFTESGAEPASLDEVLAASHVVSVHLPLTRETAGLLGKENLSRMRAGALLINTARGAIVDEAALMEALTDGHLGGAALDVRQKEPPGEHPLHALPNVLFTPHIASWTHESLHRVISTVAADVERVLTGQPARNFVNFPTPR